MKEEKGKILKLKGNTNYAYLLAGGTVLVLLCVIILFPALLLVFDKQIEKTKHKV